MDAAIELLKSAYQRSSVDMTTVGWAMMAYSVQLDEDAEVCEEAQDVFTSHGMMLPMAKGLFRLGEQIVLQDGDG